MQQPATQDALGCGGSSRLDAEHVLFSDGGLLSIGKDTMTCAAGVTAAASEEGETSCTLRSDEMSTAPEPSAASAEDEFSP
jgi:hypothetical protein